MARLDKTFPTGDCATCTLSPKLVECMRDYNVDILTMSDVTSLSGEAGRFVAEVRTRPRGVIPSKCTGCGDCWTICPVRNTAEAPPPFQPENPLTEADAAKLGGILARHEGDAGNILPILQEIDRSYGYLPRLLLEHMAFRWGLRPAELLRVASFYDRFRFEPPGRHLVEICAGTSCHARSRGTLREKLEKEIGVGVGETDKSGRFTLRTVRCLGLCALSPAMKIDGRPFGKVELERVPEILGLFA